MAKYSIESEYCSVFGTDVHARSITVRGYGLSIGKPKTKRLGDRPGAEELLEWTRPCLIPRRAVLYMMRDEAY